MYYILLGMQLCCKKYFSYFADVECDASFHKLCLFSSLKLCVGLEFIVGD